MLELSLETKVEVATSSLRHGTGLFETLRVENGGPWRLDLHLARMASGCAYLGLEAPPEAEEVLDFLDYHGVIAGLAFGILRLLAVDGRLLLFAEALSAQNPDSVSLGCSLETIRFSGNPLNRFKTLSYLENVQLVREARVRGHFEVIAPNEKGCLTDGGRTTLFAVMEGRTLTPAITEGALPGIARRVLIEAGLATEVSLRWEDLAQAEAVYLANALRGVVPVGGLEGHGARPIDHPAIKRAAGLLQEK